jgi:hypothetical protein
MPLPEAAAAAAAALGLALVGEAGVFAALADAFAVAGYRGWQ